MHVHFYNCSCNHSYKFLLIKNDYYFFFLNIIRFYRLRNPRTLKNLMVINKGGCGKYSPGIGDVQFVKDLMTDNIVTTKFRCSKFGVAHSARAKFGWVGVGV